jgi:hypothetical protein
MLTGWEKIDSLRSCLIINQQERGIYEGQDVNGRTNFNLLNSERA